MMNQCSVFNFNDQLIWNDFEMVFSKYRMSRFPHLTVKLYIDPVIEMKYGQGLIPRLILLGITEMKLTHEIV